MSQHKSLWWHWNLNFIALLNWPLLWLLESEGITPVIFCIPVISFLVSFFVASLSAASASSSSAFFAFSSALSSRSWASLSLSLFLDFLAYRSTHRIIWWKNNQICFLQHTFCTNIEKIFFSPLLKKKTLFLYNEKKVMIIKYSCK